MILYLYLDHYQLIRLLGNSQFLEANSGKENTFDLPWGQALVQYVVAEDITAGEDWDDDQAGDSGAGLNRARIWRVILDGDLTMDLLQGILNS